MISGLYRFAALILLALVGAMIWTPVRAATGWQASQTPCVATVAEAAAINVPLRNGLFNDVNWVVVLTFVDEITGQYGGTYTTQPLGEPVSASQDWSANATVCTYQSNDDQTCDDAALLDSTAFGSRDIQIPGLVSSGPVCMPTSGVSSGKGCNVTFSRDVSYQTAAGAWVSEGTYSRPTGQGSCGIAVPSSAPAPDTCKNGQPGAVNGVTVCVPFPPNTPTQSSTKKTGSETTSGGTVSSTEDKSTSCTAAGACTTTVTVTSTSNTGVVSTITTSETKPKSELCSASPGAKECGDGTSFSGDCTAGFTFEGDAIQGALATEVHKQNCLMNAITAESALYDTAKVKTGDQTGNLPGNETKAITTADIDQTNAITGGTCITDRIITINLIATTTTLVLPFSSICPLLDYFRLVLIALGFFIAYRIIGGR